MSRPLVAGLVLAAGLGTRMGGPKAELILDGERLLDRAVALLRDVCAGRVVSVIGPSSAPPAGTAVVNPRPEEGMRDSLTLGVEAVLGVPAAEQPDAIAVLLVDQPGLCASGVAAVVRAWRPGRVSVGVICEQGHRTRVHPVVMAPHHWHEALALAGPDEGARRFLMAHPGLVDEVEIAGDPIDLDTPADLARWRARSGTGE